MDLVSGTAIVFFLLAILALIIFAKTAIVVPQQSAYVVERLGRYSRHARRRVPHPRAVRGRDPLPALAQGAGDRHPGAGLHHPRQRAGRRRRRALPEGAESGARLVRHLSDYTFAIIQLAQTTLRSEIGKIDLDRTFEERTNINTAVVSELDKASEAWGVKVLRYEIKNITPPQDVLAAMEKQMRAEREKRAVILTSEGQRDAAINTAEGDKQQIIKASEATRQQQINEAEGQAAAILAVATRTAEGIRRVAEAIRLPGGYEAVQLRVAEQYIAQFGELAERQQHAGPAGQRGRRRLDDRARDERHQAAVGTGAELDAADAAATLTVHRPPTPPGGWPA